MGVLEIIRDWPKTLTKFMIAGLIVIFGIRRIGVVQKLILGGTARVLNMLGYYGKAARVHKLVEDSSMIELDLIMRGIPQSRNESIHRHPQDIKLHAEIISAISFHPNANFLVLSTFDGDLKQYCWDQEGALHESNSLWTNRQCHRVTHSSNGNKIIVSISDSNGINNELLILDSNNFQVVRSVMDATVGPVKALHSLGDNTFATGDEGGTVKVWDILRQPNPLISSVETEHYFITDIISNRNKTSIVCCSNDGTLLTLTISGELLQIVNSNEYDPELTSLGGLVGMEAKFIIGCSNGHILVGNWTDADPVNMSIRIGNGIEAINSICVYNDVVITAGGDGRIRALRCDPEELYLGLVGQVTSPIKQIAVSHDGSLLASIMADAGVVYFFNVSYLSRI